MNLLTARHLLVKNALNHRRPRATWLPTELYRKVRRSIRRA